MAIRRLLEQGSFDPEEISVLVTAYDKVVEELHLAPEQYEPANEVIAMKVIELCRGGFKDAKSIAGQIIAQFQIPTAES